MREESFVVQPTLVTEPIRRAESEQDMVRGRAKNTDVYFSADVETDGPIPGP